MIDDVSDARLDALIRKQRPDRVRTSAAWRQAQRRTLLAYISGSHEGGDVVGDRGTTQRVLKTKQPETESSRAWGWAAAGVLITAGIGALALFPNGEPDSVAPSGAAPSGPSLPDNTANDPSEPTPNMVTPGIAVSPEVGRLMSLPTCESADGLGEWTVEQLRWWRNLDPETVQPALFSEVTTLVAVDTAATSATCSTAIAIDGALTWGLGDGTGNWVARATGVPDASDYEWPAQQRERNGDDGTGGQFGTGQFFNDFNIAATSLEATAAGALSPASPSSPSPIYIIEFADELSLETDPSRLWHLRTTAPVLDENVSGRPNPSLVPTLVPEGFGRCTVEYARQSPSGQLAFAIDYCSTTSTITVTAGQVVDGDTIVVDGIEMIVERNNDTLRVGFPTDGPMVVGPASIPERALAETLASIPAVGADIDASNQRKIAATAAIDAAYQEIVEAIQPRTEYSAATWSAREIVMVRCMADVGFEWRARPNGAANPTGTDGWPAWEEWFNAQAASDPDFKIAAFGGEELNGTNVGGCQLEAGRKVHGEGEEAFSRAADLENAVLASKTRFVEMLDPTADINAAATAGAAAWLNENTATIEDLRRDLADELAAARSIIDGAELEN